MKVAFATTDGIRVDEHFGRTAKFLIYEFTGEGYKKVEERIFSGEARDAAVENTKGMGAEHDAAVEAKVEKVSDCKIVYMTNIGGPSAARLGRKGILPVKVKEGTSILVSAEALMQTIKNAPPPWMIKLL
jgi:nitrogen fixation protein NifX